MHRKEALFAVIGGIVGAVLVMAAGSFAPVGAQNEVKDVEFGKITCSMIQVGDRSNGGVTLLPGQIIVGSTESVVSIFSMGDLASLTLSSGRERRESKVIITSVSSNGAITVDGVISVNGENGEVEMTTDEQGGRVGVVGKNGKARIATHEQGAAFHLFGKGDQTSCVAMEINEYGNGAVSTWDKNGYRLATLK